MQSSPEFIPVTVDKSHIITIGERLYAESIEFVRELVNNAYDADATLVEITVYAPKSPIYGRDRIGQFGIGKFASLSACRRFEIITKKDDFVGRVIFDKEQWERSEDVWQLPFEKLTADFRKHNGTTVILMGLDRKFDRLCNLRPRYRGKGQAGNYKKRALRHGNMGEGNGKGQG